MNVQILIATMDQTDHSLLQKMNIQSDAIVCNQCDRYDVEQFEWNSHRIQYYSFRERGVGLNRNNALMRADADICVFADDDIVYNSNYVLLLRKAFAKYPDADVIVFNLAEKNSKRQQITKPERVNRLNYLRYGTARIAIRLSSIRNNGIFFNQCFGGGTPHCHGEDNLFLSSCLDKKLRVYAVPITLGTLTNERVSTWNNGYTKKYFQDQGILYYTISRKWWKLLCVQDAYRHRKMYKMNWVEVFRLMTSGVHSQKEH